MNPATIGWIGGIGGSLIGLAGGIIGTYLSIRNTPNERARKFVIKCSIFIWAAVLLCIGLPLALWLTGRAPMWLYWTFFGLFFTVLFPFIFWVNRRLAEFSQPRGWDAVWKQKEA